MICTGIHLVILSYLCMDSRLTEERSAVCMQCYCIGYTFIIL
jgi:hypothetical protein